MIIKSLEDINNIKTMVRVIDSTHYPNKETKAMVGSEVEFKGISLDGTKISIRIDECQYFWFNKKDLQELTPIEYKGRLVGRGDEVLYGGEWCEVYGYYWDDNRFVLTCAVGKAYSNCTGISQKHIEDIRPLYTPKPEEIITVGEYRYKLIKE